MFGLGLKLKNLVILENQRSVIVAAAKVMQHSWAHVY